MILWILNFILYKLLLVYSGSINLNCIGNLIRISIKWYYKPHKEQVKEPSFGILKLLMFYCVSCYYLISMVLAGIRWIVLHAWILIRFKWYVLVLAASSNYTMKTNNIQTGDLLLSGQVKKICPISYCLGWHCINCLSLTVKLNWKILVSASTCSK